MSKAKAAPAPVEEPTTEEVVPVKGTGTFAFPDGSMYVGDYVEVDGVKTREGEGTLTMGAESYCGCWVGDKMNGKGKYKFAGGNTYEGIFAEGMFDGEGTYVFNDGGIYKGLWKQNSMHGMGEYTDTNQTKWAGEFFNGMFDTGKSYIALRPPVPL